ncbi:MAG: hypothetical protein Q4F41_16125 [Eubacteriales bacterium]|nr:hypothetical protein [Eubacteriales bacterium]
MSVIPEAEEICKEQDIRFERFHVGKGTGDGAGEYCQLCGGTGSTLCKEAFCDAQAYDAGYLALEEIAGKVAVKGRDGTILQPGVDLLANAKDFPKDGPILLITDGEIEEKIHIRREHAFLVPRRKRFPFRAKREVFYYE